MSPPADPQRSLGHVFFRGTDHQKILGLSSRRRHESSLLEFLSLQKPAAARPVEGFFSASPTPSAVAQSARTRPALQRRSRALSGLASSRTLPPAPLALLASKRSLGSDAPRTRWQSGLRLVALQGLQSHCRLQLRRNRLPHAVALPTLTTGSIITLIRGSVFGDHYDGDGAACLLDWAQHVRLSAVRKHRRGPKKPALEKGIDVPPCCGQGSERATGARRSAMAVWR